MAAQATTMDPRDDITAVPGLRAGHWTDRAALTGCTVVLTEAGAAAGVDVRGAAPGTRETDLLGLGRTVERIHAVLLTGGSAFGLAAADGVMGWLREQGIGHPMREGPVPIVPGAVIYDLGLGAAVAPDAAAGRAACEAAIAGEAAALPQGTVGAGTGATVGKLRGAAGAMKGGIGSASRRMPFGRYGTITIGALVVVNAVGDIYDPASGAIVAGARAPDGDWLDGNAALRSGALFNAASAAPPEDTTGANTTIAVLATDAPLDRSAAYRLAQNGHDAYARAIRPCHTPFDGDTIFALSTRPGPIEPFALATLAAAAEEVLERAILRAVQSATGAGGVPGLAD
jgi:L-aminopeptidase/D-esterase-like protein